MSAQTATFNLSLIGPDEVEDRVKVYNPGQTATLVSEAPAATLSQTSSIHSKVPKNPPTPWGPMCGTPLPPS